MTTTLAPARDHPGGSAARVRRMAVALLVVLLAVDAVLIGGHVVHALGPDGRGWLATSRWSVERDRGVPEVWGYLQFSLVIAGLVFLGRLRRQPVYPAWALAFAVVVLDDGMMVHERGGRVLVRLMGSPAEIAGFRAQDAGEMTVWALLGAGVAVVLLLAHRRSDAAARGRSAALVVPVGVFLFFGMVLDQLHGLADERLHLPSWVNAVVGTVEDGGELVSGSVILAFVGALVARTWPTRG